ncbi:hypothetical protein L6452_37842 [Arctium lappa]|uniref:Uncharacterized protein n=1 Tax=Arctium lappa TaxID=4217 RepID=A0ACB8Y442_ARCLA|nr:hypothetical protein L6452_37842 [Arctium lappa]
MQRRFRANQLKPNANVWVNFLRHSISPTTHQTYVSVDRMLLLHCLLQGFSINFGEVVLKSIQSSAKAKRGGMFFPGLLTQMMNLMAQNNELLEQLRVQRDEFMGKIDSLRTDLSGKVSSEGETSRGEMEQMKRSLEEKYAVKLRKMKKKVKTAKRKMEQLSKEKAEVEAELKGYKEQITAATLPPPNTQPTLGE